jgi:hypothetical protein
MSSRNRWLALALLLPATVPAQSVDLMIHNTGISIGDSRYVNGLRLNFRDERMEFVRGINATIWRPYDDNFRGTVHGLALGLPMTGARDVRGFGIGVLGVGASRDFRGLGFGLVGIGIIGAGAGGDVTGFTFGGIGAGAGGNMKGITIGGIGAGAGGNMTGLSLGLVGAGAGGNMTGISLGGVGAGAGGNMKGLTAAIIGAGAGHDVTGITIAGIGAGAGGTLRGLAIGGVGAGAPRLRGIAIGLNVGGNDVRAGVLAPLYFKVVPKRDRATYEDVEDYGYVKGVTIASWNHIKGEQHGLSIGLLNSAWELNGWQIGVLNYARNNPKWARLLPVFNRKW